MHVSYSDHTIQWPSQKNTKDTEKDKQIHNIEIQGRQRHKKATNADVKNTKNLKLLKAWFQSKQATTNCKKVVSIGNFSLQKFVFDPYEKVTQCSVILIFALVTS